MNLTARDLVDAFLKLGWNPIGVDFSDLPQNLLNSGPYSTKRAVMALSGDNEATTTSNADFLMRIPFMLPVNTTRYRIKVLNQASSTPLKITDTFLCFPAFTSNNVAFVGNVTNPSLLFYGGQTVPNSALGSSTFYGPWVTSPSQQISSDTMYVLSLGVTCPSGTALNLGVGPGCSFRGTGSAAQVNVPSPTGGTFNSQTPFLDIQIEFEFLGNNPVALILGDSLSVGNSDAPAPLGNVMGPSTASWPGIAAQRNRFIATNASIAGRTFFTFESLLNPSLNRFDLANCPPNVLILACGVNEVNGLQALSAYQSEIVGILNNIAQPLGINRIYLCTLFPQTRWKAGYLTAGAASGVSSVTTTIPFADGDIIDIDSENSTLSERLTVMGASTGVGPYTTTFTGTTVNAHTNQSTIWTKYETLRRQYNVWIRSWPPGITGIFDFDRVLGGTLSDGVTAVALGGSATVHPGVTAYQRVAETVLIPPQ